MKRDLEQHLLRWKKHPFRKPLIIRGARQVGKSWLVDHFSKHFDHYVTVNLDTHTDLKELFINTRDPQLIIEKLRILSGGPLEPGKSLIFIDEIQESVEALKALRYFKEKCPEYHVIAAGSLLDFSLEEIGTPVGRVQYMYLHPLSFAEFLTAMDKDSLRKHLLSYDMRAPLDNIFHTELNELLRHYMWLGGMPAVIDAWIKSKNPTYCLEIQDEIVTGYRDDFPKYAKKYQLPRVTEVFNSIPHQLGKKFKHTAVNKEIKSRDLKDALLLLEKAGIAKIFYHSDAQGYPLAAGQNQSKAKVFLHDIGLVQRMLGLNLAEWISQPLHCQHLGSIAEQFVAQEYIAYTSTITSPELFYWHREGKNRNAEVDFLFNVDSRIVPVEVKSGRQGGLKSLALFLEEHPDSPKGLKICEQPFMQQSNYLQIPFYAIEGWLAKDSMR